MRSGGDDSPTFRGTPKRLDVAIAVRPLCKTKWILETMKKPFQTAETDTAHKTAHKNRAQKPRTKPRTKTVSSAFNRK
jgi:hypothetical protein